MVIVKEIDVKRNTHQRTFQQPLESIKNTSRANDDNYKSFEISDDQQLKSRVNDPSRGESLDVRLKSNSISNSDSHYR